MKNIKYVVQGMYVFSGHEQQSKHKLCVTWPQVKHRQAAVFLFQTKQRPLSLVRQIK